MAPAVLVGIYVALGLAPLLLAAIQVLPARGFWRDLSSGLVSVGFAMVLAQFLLSGRFRRISGKVGIDLTMRFHQLAGWAVFAFVVLHPILYAVPRLETGPDVALAALRGMFLSGGLRTGVLAWCLLILLVVLAAWRDRLPVRYEIWRASHGVGAALVALLGVHHTLAVGTYSADPLLAAFWGILAIVALAALVHVYAVKPILQLRSPYRVAVNEKAAERMWRLVVEPRAGAAIDFAPGQFVWLNLGHSPFSLTEHPFSISSAPADRPRIEFTIKESGDFTDRIGEIGPGTRAHIDGPHGNFTTAGHEVRRLVMIAGGVGVAPVMGILRQLEADGWPHPVTLVYGNRVETQILYREELEAMRAAHGLDLHLVLSQPPEGWSGPVGELTPDVLRRCLSGFDHDAHYFVCGPLPMMDVVEKTLADHGVPDGRIVSERFKYS